MNHVLYQYWDHLNVTDTATLFKKQSGERLLVDYLYMLDHTSAALAHSGLATFLDKTLTSQAVFGHFSRLLEKYLYYPDSPLRNEELYIDVLAYYMQDERLDPVDKVKFQYQLSMLYKNRLGHTAENFNFVTPSGNKSNLYSINAPLTLLFFYDPDCENCRETIRQLSGNLMLKSMQDKKELQVLAVYTADNIKLWKDYASLIPSQWVNGYDKQQINKQKIYDLRAYPTLYLLDKNKTVVLKDTYLDLVLDNLHNVANQ